MSLFELPTGKSAVVTRIPSDEKLILFGVIIGARVTLLFISPFRSAFLLQTKERRVLLSRRLAIGIEVVAV